MEPVLIYPSVLVHPHKRRKQLLSLSDSSLFSAIFDPALSPEWAILGSVPPPESVYLPPFNPMLQSSISDPVKDVIATSLSGVAAPGPTLMPVINLDSDVAAIPDPHERAYRTLTRAQRLKTLQDR